MEKVIEVVIILNSTEYLRIEQPLNPDASVLTGLEVTLKGTTVGTVEAKPADTRLSWRPSVPIVVPQEEA